MRAYPIKVKKNPSPVNRIAFKDNLIPVFVGFWSVINNTSSAVIF